MRQQDLSAFARGVCLCFLLLSTSTSANDSRSISFDNDVRPILQKCIGCHGPDRPEADLNLTSRTALDREVIVPHEPATSLLLERVTSTDPDVRMPPDASLSASEIEVLRRWIATGADWPEHWSYRPLSKPEPPLVSDSLRNWCENPVDRFIAERLHQVGLVPSPRADRRTLMRRLYYDLLGLPPTPDEVSRFESDDRPDAYHRVVESVLASPRYGERWARHWMDIVHFAETHGHDQDRPRENAWPYRDYLIRRFNEDVPYGQFIREQVAGDALSQHDAWSVVGTGMLAAGPWDESSLRDIQENSLDREIGRYLDRDDIVTTVMSTFASTSVHCARCHHHKFDPITQDEYYGLQAVFAGIDKANRKYDQAPAIAKRRKELNDRLREIESWTNSDVVLDLQTQRAVAAWEEQRQGAIPQWSEVELLEITSTSGQTMTREPDGSVYAGGKRPDKDQYVVVFNSDLPNVRAIRLTVFADDRMPMNGPGRQDNGNFHLNEIRLFVASEDDTTAQRRVAITKASADFSQADWTIEKSIDGNTDSAWGIFPKVGKTHHAVFEFEPTTAATFRVELDQIHGGGHLIGRFRVAATNATEALHVEPELPADIVAILETSSDERTDKERARLAAFVERQRVEGEIADLPSPSLVYCGTNQFEPDGSFRPTKHPRRVHVLDRGEIGKPLRPAKATTLSCVQGIGTASPLFDNELESERRVALANWLASEKNGLVWRSIANRVWHYHFGNPLVDTPNDFGIAGSAPTHPQLLEWLAADLQKNGGSLKALHQTIVTSATYQQSSDHRPDPAKLDAGNRLLWRMNRSRLDAESFRDSLLQLSGTLDTRMGGPSDRHFNQSKGVHVTPVVDYQGFDINDRVNFRRSVYRFVFRTVPDPFMEALDCPDAAQLSPQRGESITAVQTLATMNDKFVARQCELVAARIQARYTVMEDQVAEAVRLINCRAARKNELTAVIKYVQQHGLANACRLLVNTNEFMFVD